MSPQIEMTTFRLSFLLVLYCAATAAANDSWILSALRFDSREQEAFSCQLCYHSGNQQWRQWSFKNHGKMHMLIWTNSELSQIFSDDREMVVSDGELLVTSPRSWNFEVSPKAIQFDSFKPDETKSHKPIVAFNLQSTVSKLGEANEYDPLIGYARFGELSIRFRTPNDTVALGYPLVSVFVEKRHKMLLSGVTTNSDVDACELNNEYVNENAVVVDVRPTTRGGDWNNFLKKEKIYRKLMVSDSQLHSLPEFFKGLVSGDNRQRELKISNTMAGFRSLISHLSPSNTLPLDDPVVKWSRIERYLGYQAFDLHDTLLRVLEQGDSVHLNDRLQIVDLLSDIGEPPVIIRPSKVDPTLFPLWPVFEAVFLAKFRKPWTDEHVRLCQQNLKNLSAGSGGALTLTKTLILMGQIESIPKLRVEHWYKSQVVDGTSFQRLEALRQLTITPSGRKWLVDRIVNNKSDSDEINQLGISALRLRGEATLKTERWDFMSKAECNEILVTFGQLK